MWYKSMLIIIKHLLLSRRTLAGTIFKITDFSVIFVSCDETPNDVRREDWKKRYNADHIVLTSRRFTRNQTLLQGSDMPSM